MREYLCRIGDTEFLIEVDARQAVRQPAIFGADAWLLEGAKARRVIKASGTPLDCLNASEAAAAGDAARALAKALGAETWHLDERPDGDVIILEGTWTIPSQPAAG